MRSWGEWCSGAWEGGGRHRKKLCCLRLLPATVLVEFAVSSCLVAHGNDFHFGDESWDEFKTVGCGLQGSTLGQMGSIEPVGSSECTLVD